MVASTENILTISGFCSVLCLLSIVFLDIHIHSFISLLYPHLIFLVTDQLNK